MTDPWRSDDGRADDQYGWCDDGVPGGAPEGSASRGLVLFRHATWTAAVAIGVATILAILDLTGVL